MVGPNSNDVKNTFMLWVAGLAKMYSEKEMVWEDEWRGGCEGDEHAELYSETVIEFFNNSPKNFAIRRYYKNGQLYWEDIFENEERKSFIRYDQSGKITYNNKGR